MTVAASPAERVACLNLDGGLDSLALLLHAGVGLGAHDTTTPVAAGLLGLLSVALLDGRQQLGELRLVLVADVGNSENSSGLQKTESEQRKQNC